MNEYVSNPDEAKEYWGRYKLFYITITITVLLFTIRLWYLQVFQGSELRNFSEKNRIKQNKIQAPRGLFLDRDGKVMVENLPGFEAIILPQYIEDLQNLANSIGPIIGVEPEKVIQKIQRAKKQNGPFSQIRLKENLSREEVIRLKRIRIDSPGLEIRESIVRSYPLRENGAQIFGYVGEISKKQLQKYNEKFKDIMLFEQGDIIGKSGLEENLEKYVRGLNGISFIQVDAHGRETISQNDVLYGGQISDQEPSHGNNAVLTLDRDIQEAAYNSFVDNKRIGAAVAMKANGEILAWINSPSFDPNEFSGGIKSQTFSRLINDPFKPFRNKVIQDHNAPGSTFKPLIAVAALQEKIITDKTLISAPGLFMYAGRPYHDSHKEGHGVINVYEAIERSSNVFFYKMGISLGIDKMYNYISLLGIGVRTGIEMSREVPGLMPNSEWKKKTFGEEWQGGENLSTAIGQGFVTVTPIQMAIAYNTIATEGKVVKPFIVKKIMNQEGKIIKENEPQVIRDVTQVQPNGYKIDPETFHITKEGMRRVIQGERGTARLHKIPGIEMAGKTGTAQVMGFTADKIYNKCASMPIHMRHHGWFVAFAPFDNPEITVAVLAEHACSGAGGAAPIVKDIMYAYFQKNHPELIAAGKNLKKPATSKPATSNTPPPPSQRIDDGDFE